MGPFEGLLFGLSVAIAPTNIFACFAGVLAGTVVGVLPGIGPNAGIALLLPVTFAMQADTALIMLAGIYYGAMYGGSTTAILLNLPGEAASVVTAIDGYQMAKKGRAGAALFISAIGSFVAGTAGLFGLVLVGTWLANFALNFGPPEYFMLALLGLVFLSRLSGGSLLKAILMTALGLAIATVGIDPVRGAQRFTLGVVHLAQGIDLVPVIMGLYGVSEVFTIAEEGIKKAQIRRVRIRELLPSKDEARLSALPILRGSIIGFFIGLIPGPATVMSSFVSYALERKLSKSPERFGQGAIEGVAGPESANNSATAGAMVPLLSLGIPFAPATAILLSAFIIHGIQPGPMLVLQRPEVFWGLIASMYIGNAMLLVLNLPLVGIFVSILRIPQHILSTLVLLLCLVGAYSLNNSLLDLWVLIVMGAFGYVLRKIKVDPAPLVVALVLGTVMEKTLCQALFMAHGEWRDLLYRPFIAFSILAILSIFLLSPVVSRFQRKSGSNRA